MSQRLKIGDPCRVTCRQGNEYVSEHPLKNKMFNGHWLCPHLTSNSLRRIFEITGVESLSAAGVEAWR